jgi:deoxyribodipyrimidine photo-lyase
MKEYVFGKPLGHYAKSRNDIDGANFSSKFSPWLANGSLSVNTVYHSVLEAEDKLGGKSASVNKFIDELLWRDFCWFWSMRN